MIKSIIIDATHVAAGQTTGVENYTFTLLPLLSQKLLKKGVSVSWIGHTSEPSSLPNGVSWITSPHTRFWSQRGLPKSLAALKPDLFFSPSGLTPIFYKGKTAITIHDMAAYILPQVFTFAQTVRLRFLIKKNAQRAAVILSPSQYTKENIIHFWHLPAKKIVVTPLALTIAEAKPEPLSGIPDTARMFVFTGRIEFKKNLQPVIEGFARLEDPNVYLVLVGKEGFGAEEIKKCIDILPEEHKSRVLLPGYISDGQKQWLLKNAYAAIVPGMVEGFGLPLLEPMIYSTPVMCSKAGSLPEVGKDAVHYVKGDDSNDWYIQMKKLLEEPALRDEYGEKGQKLLSEFSWDQTAELTAQSFLTL